MEHGAYNKESSTQGFTLCNNEGIKSGAYNLIIQLSSCNHIRLLRELITGLDTIIHGLIYPESPSTVLPGEWESEMGVVIGII